MANVYPYPLQYPKKHLTPTSENMALINKTYVTKSKETIINKVINNLKRIYNDFSFY